MTKSLSALIFVYFELLNLYFPPPPGCAALLFSEIPYLHLDAGNCQALTVVLARLANQTLHMQDTIKIYLCLCI